MHNSHITDSLTTNLSNACEASADKGSDSSDDGDSVMATNGCEGKPSKQPSAVNIYTSNPFTNKGFITDEQLPNALAIAEYTDNQSDSELSSSGDSDPCAKEHHPNGMDIKID